MEIPYVINPRKDTGLTNSKIGIWLFLASEVMLFGGLFSGYIFLRVYSDYPWPERVLPILPGLINTFILILSSITVVFAWCMLKLRKWNMFRLFMAITIGCAALFMGLKVLEYKAKFSHQAVRLPDYTILEGHVHKEKVDSHGHILHSDHGGHHAKSEKGGAHGNAKSQETSIDKIIFSASAATFDLSTYNKGFVEDLIAQATTLGAEIKLAKDLNIQIKPGVKAEVVAKAGDPLTYEVLESAQSLFKKARANNAKVRTKELRKQWKTAKAENPDLPGWKNAENITIDPAVIKNGLVEIVSSVDAVIEPKVAFLFNSRSTDVTDTSAKRKDGTLLTGSLHSSPMELGVDGVDFTFLVQHAEEKGIDPDQAIEESWILKNNSTIKAYWEQHKAHIAKLEVELLEAAGGDKEKAKVPTEVEKYKMTWKELVRYGSEGAIDLQWYDGFTGANHTNEEQSQYFPDVSLPREQIAFESKFTPRWNNYYAIYFTITGLHGLHIIGGAIVLGYYMFCPNMFRENPEWLANRVEIAGLFWHFVDLVWIFLFPILYLM